MLSSRDGSDGPGADPGLETDAGPAEPNEELAIDDDGSCLNAVDCTQRRILDGPAVGWSTGSDSSGAGELSEIAEFRLENRSPGIGEVRLPVVLGVRSTPGVLGTGLSNIGVSGVSSVGLKMGVSGRIGVSGVMVRLGRDCLPEACTILGKFRAVPKPTVGRDPISLLTFSSHASSVTRASHIP